MRCFSSLSIHASVGHWVVFRQDFPKFVRTVRTQTRSFIRILFAHRPFARRQEQGTGAVVRELANAIQHQVNLDGLLFKKHQETRNAPDDRNLREKHLVEPSEKVTPLAVYQLARNHKCVNG